MKPVDALLFASLLSALFVLAFSAQADAQSQPQDEGFRFFGFVKHDMYYDSRTMVAARQGQFSLYPAPVLNNEAGNDRNDVPQFHMLAIQSRLGVESPSFEAFGAQARGFVEGAFFGNIESDINGFRLRHAFVELNWDGRHKLLMGQYWHPMFAVNAVPGVVAFNTGAPFKPFSRNPQIRYTFSPGSTEFIAAAMSQIDFVSQGGTYPLRRSGIPNLHGQIRQHFGSFVAGAGIDFKALRPDILSGEEYVYSLAGTTFGTYASGYTRVMAQVTYGQNLFDHLMLGGIGLNQPDPENTLNYSLINISTGAAWMDVSHGNRFRGGLFAGYTQNFGADEAFTGGTALPAYRGTDIETVWRIAPRAEWNSGPVRLSLEAEISAAAYGSPDNEGVVRNAEDVTNFRLLFASWFFF
ncbi:MAG: hypothetical protein LAT84_06235 [Balneolia bacterium]|nr:hypothetical protein [Balneolia bacterium]